jgi:hypothetical protein
MAGVGSAEKSCENWNPKKQVMNKARIFCPNARQHLEVAIVELPPPILVGKSYLISLSP